MEIKWNNRNCDKATELKCLLIGCTLTKPGSALVETKRFTSNKTVQKISLELIAGATYGDKLGKYGDKKA